MSTSEIIALISIALSILYVWGKSQNDVAKLQEQNVATNARITVLENSLKEFIKIHIELEGNNNTKVMDKLDELKEEVNSLKVEMAANGFNQATSKPKRTRKPTPKI